MDKASQLGTLLWELELCPGLSRWGLVCWCQGSWLQRKWVSKSSTKKRQQMYIPRPSTSSKKHSRHSIHTLNPPHFQGWLKLQNLNETLAAWGGSALYMLYQWLSSQLSLHHHHCFIDNEGEGLKRAIIILLLSLGQQGGPGVSTTDELPHLGMGTWITQWQSILHSIQPVCTCTHDLSRVTSTCPNL